MNELSQDEKRAVETMRARIIQQGGNHLDDREIIQQAVLFAGQVMANPGYRLIFMPLAQDALTSDDYRGLVEDLDGLAGILRDHARGLLAAPPDAPARESSDENPANLH